MSNCYKCNKEPVKEEFERCGECETTHKELALQLDARPKTREIKVKEKLYPIKEVKQGIQVTTWISQEDARNMGIKINE